MNKIKKVTIQSRTELDKLLQGKQIENNEYDIIDYLIVPVSKPHLNTQIRLIAWDQVSKSLTIEIAETAKLSIHEWIDSIIVPKKNVGGNNIDTSETLMFVLLNEENSNQQIGSAIKFDGLTITSCLANPNLFFGGMSLTYKIHFQYKNQTIFDKEGFIEEFSISDDEWCDNERKIVVEE